ncbi:MAG: DMT family transporter [Phenylobacterium sp.]|uniref:DMT family transporter n=1 Tax=Phenylobacterium sp. TaxID=1871053 RepID=UPI002736FB4B|nr:DMT family transporter [Phenylobacterium sp.]MDP3746921.1 DMT family transporter [Phenylobacterium sp.]
MALRDFALLVLVCLVWAANNIVSKFVVSYMDVPPLFYAAVRFAVVAVVVFPWLRNPPQPIWRLLVVALLMGGGNFALMFVGLKSSTPSSVAVVSQVMVPMTTFLSFMLLGERLTRRRLFGIGLTLLGALTVMWDPHGFRIAPGLLFVVGAAFMGSLGAVMLKQMDGLKPLQMQAWVGLSSFLPLIALSAWLEPGAAAVAVASGWPFVAAVLFSGLIVSVVGHTLYYGLIQRYEANLISPLTLMTPLATIGLGVLITHDPFDARMAFGAAVAIAGVLIIALRPNQAMLLLLALRNRDK